MIRAEHLEPENIGPSKFYRHPTFLSGHCVGEGPPHPRLPFFPGLPSRDELRALGGESHALGADRLSGNGDAGVSFELAAWRPRSFRCGGARFRQRELRKLRFLTSTLAYP